MKAIKMITLYKNTVYFPAPGFLPGKSHGYGAQSVGHKKVRHDLATKQQQIILKNSLKEQ